MDVCIYDILLQMIEVKEEPVDDESHFEH